MDASLKKDAVPTPIHQSSRSCAVNSPGFPGTAVTAVASARVDGIKLGEEYGMGIDIAEVCGDAMWGEADAKWIRVRYSWLHGSCRDAPRPRFAIGYRYVHMQIVGPGCINVGYGPWIVTCGGARQ